ncbi:MAG: ribonuclease P protein component [Candidatus Fraserbacteria bacterium RBG_16_55_9]|uniref:Ribonuclease P protein component n=1 Tax=Fraserbacteria sp. (strain RBG_16_55_9) TaxID=1817864 RepID=A0A1F5V1M3_FRAXR|nr:MAG: ribonuclease P protein component [Candidatus Fraserbacteria bacterium RBG_16_55_9]
MTTIVTMRATVDNWKSLLSRLQSEDRPSKMKEAMPQSQRFQRIHRLTRGADFERAYQTGRLIQNEHFRIYVLGQEEGSPPRLGLSVTKRLGKANVRNRLKRWIREWFRTHKEELSNLALVVQPKPPAARLDHKALLESAQRLIASLK